MGLEQPDDGEVLIDEDGGARQRGRIPHRAALVFQRNAPLDNLTVAQNVAFPLRHNADQDRLQRRIEHMMIRLKPRRFGTVMLALLALALAGCGASVDVTVDLYRGEN